MFQKHQKLCKREKKENCVSLCLWHKYIFIGTTHTDNYVINISRKRTKQLIIFDPQTNATVLLVNSRMQVHCTSRRLIGNDSTPLAGLAGLPWHPKSSCTQTWNAGSKITLLHNLEQKMSGTLKILKIIWPLEPEIRYICPHSNKHLTQRCPFLNTAGTCLE